MSCFGSAFCYDYGVVRFIVSAALVYVMYGIGSGGVKKSNDSKVCTVWVFERKTGDKTVFI